MSSRWMRLPLALAGLAMVATLAPVAAQAQKPADAPPAAANPHADAERLISQGANGSAGRYFANVTRPGGPATVIHSRSGLICVYDALPVRGELMVYPASSGIPEGDDVSCNLMNSAGEGYLETLYATRYASGDLQSHYQAALAEMRARFGALEPWSPAAADPADSAGRQTMTARYRVVMDGQVVYTRLSMAQVGPWTVMMRFSAPIDDGERADRAASQAFGDAVSQVVRGSAS